jgi:hypothetical protein
VLAHTVPRALVAQDGQGRLVARVALPSFASPVSASGGLTRPPGGAALKQKQQVVSRSTAVGRASIWSAPDRVSPARCSWLQIGRAIYGGSCLRDKSLGRGLPEVVPLLLRIKGRTVPILWGHAGANVAGLRIVFQDGSRTSLSQREGVFLYPIPHSRWSRGHRPAFLVARDSRGRLIRKQLLSEYTLAP